MNYTVVDYPNYPNLWIFMWDVTDIYTFYTSCSQLDAGTMRNCALVAAPLRSAMPRASNIFGQASWHDLQIYNILYIIIHISYVIYICTHILGDARKEIYCRFWHNTHRWPALSCIDFFLKRCWVQHEPICGAKNCPNVVNPMVNPNNTVTIWG